MEMEKEKERKRKKRDKAKVKKIRTKNQLSDLIKNTILLKMKF